MPKRAAYNGHFGCTCYHPLFVFSQFGDLERCALQPGNVHSADGWRELLELVIARFCESRFQTHAAGVYDGRRLSVWHAYKGREPGK